MKTVIQLVLVAAVLGGASAAGTLFWQRHQAALNDANERAEVAEAKAKEDPLADLQKPTAESKPEEVAPPPKKEPPVAARPPFVEGADEASQLVVSLNQRLRAAHEKEQRLNERQEALKLIFADIRSERAEINNLRQQFAEDLDKSPLSAQELIKSAEQERDLLRRELEALQKAAPKTEAPPNTEGSQSSENPSSKEESDPALLKRLGAIYDSMPAEVVADVLLQLAKKGREPAVVQLLQTMKDRQAGKVLTTIAATDPTLAASLTEKLKRP